MHVDPSGPTYQINLEGVAKETTDDPTDKGCVLCSIINGCSSCCESVQVVGV